MVMTCEEVERGELAERYVLGQLDERQEEAFEDHYFACAACLEQVRALQDARDALSVQEVRAPRRTWPRVAAVLATAAAVLLAVRVGQELWSPSDTPPPSSSPRADVVLPAPPARARIVLPPYTPPRLRAVPREAQRAFQEAMVSYVAGNCTAALPGLQRAVSLDASLLQARFYLAACELHEARPNDAVVSLERVIAAGESPYLEDARFLLAHARIEQRDIEGARQELRRVIAMQGERRAEAQRLLDDLR